MNGSVAAFALFAAILTITPGLDTFLVLRTTAVSGRAAGLFTAIGIGAGCLVWALASAVGVTAVLAASRAAFEVLRAAGVAYLCWLGGRALWRSRRSAYVAAPAVDEAAPAQRPDDSYGKGWRALRTGLLTNLLNPKVGVFYLSVMPQFLPAGLNPFAGSMALGVIHVGEGLVWLTLLVLAVNLARGWLTRPAVRRRLDQVSGVAFLGFGLKLALDRGPRG